MDASAPLCVTGGGNNFVGEIVARQVASGVQATNDGVRAMLATLTAAKLAGKKVRVYADNAGTWGCKVGAIDFAP